MQLLCHVMAYISPLPHAMHSMPCHVMSCTNTMPSNILQASSVHNEPASSQQYSCPSKQ